MSDQKIDQTSDRMIERNKALIDEWAERGWNQKDAAAIDDCFAEDFRGYDAYSGQAFGRPGVRAFFDEMHGAFADFRIRVDDVVAEDERAYARYLCTGTHAGEFAGVAATGKSVAFPVIGYWHIRDGKFVASTQQYGRFGLLSQLGANRFGAVPGAVLDPGPGPKARADVPAEEREANKQMIRGWMDDAWHKRDPDAVDRYMAEDVWFWDSSSPPVEGREVFRQWTQGLADAFANSKVGVHDMVAEGDKTAYRITIQGDHVYDFQGCKPCGGKLDIESLNIVRHEDGKMKEGWQIFDALTLFEQITGSRGAALTTEA